ncbi:MAG: T9SS type A sorting domain-containing protein [Bacteroidetes Order II. Incertae sedis bacterium]|nr:T9SS type A sorting domain-containing protein [Bacteroidetes Order II. bacterium]
MKTLTPFILMLCFGTTSLYAQFTTNWSLAHGSMPGLGQGSSSLDLYRGLAYGVVGGNERLYYVSRYTGNHIYILNANTGAAASPAELSLTGVAGGALVLNDVGVSEDGVIFACNVSANSDAASPFRCHRWDTESQLEATHYTFQTPAAARLGDKITVTGSVSGGNLAIWVASVTNNKAYKLTLPASGTVLSGTEYSTDATIGNQASVFPYGAGFVVNGNSTAPKYYETTSATVAGTLPAASIGGTVNNNALRIFSSGGKTFLATFAYSGTIGAAGAQYSIRVANLSNTFATGWSYGFFDIANPASSANGNGAGDVDVRINGDGTATIFAMATNNGIVSVNTTNSLATLSDREENPLPTAFYLSAPYPNPFNPSANVTFSVKQGQSVTLTLVNLLGQSVQALFTGSVPANALQTVRINAGNLPAGTYFVRLSGETFHTTRPLTLLK